MVQGYFSAERLVTKRIQLGDIAPQGFETLVAGKNQIRILVRAPE